MYSFAIEGKELPSIAAVSRLRRDEDADVHGYQRPEVLSHIAAIRRYIESESPMIPNALVIAFDKRVTFSPISEAPGVDYARPGILSIPIAEDASEERPGWIVDGQQRSAAIRDAQVGSFPICVTSFITDSDDEQRSQFILVNSAKPLPKGLIYELLPATSGTLPVALQLRKFPSLLLRRLNCEVRSPLYKLIRTPTMPDGIIKDNSILKMLENSLSDGALYRFRDLSTGQGDDEAMIELLNQFWSAARQVFADAWAKPARQSRLMHGVGIISLGFLMDAIFDRYSGMARHPRLISLLILANLPTSAAGRMATGSSDRPASASGTNFRTRPATSKLLTSYLLFEYKTRVWGKTADPR